MTNDKIDEAVAWLNTDDYESKGFADATIVAIDIMRKYQKIIEILNYLENGTVYFYEYNENTRIRQIRKVDCPLKEVNDNSVLEQIKAEIKDNQTDWCYNSNDPVERAYYKAYTRCLKIVDKYTKGDRK